MFLFEPDFESGVGRLGQGLGPGADGVGGVWDGGWGLGWVGAVGWLGWGVGWGLVVGWGRGC